MEARIKRHNTTVLESLKKGDLVEIKRGLYSHWAVYAGDEKLIHLTGDANNGSVTYSNSNCLLTICDRQFNKAYVKLDDFWDVVKGCKVYKNNFKDKAISPATGEEIVERGLAMRGDIGYNVLSDNCEHFASSCRYQNPESKQAVSVIKWITFGALSVLLKKWREPTLWMIPIFALARQLWSCI